MNTAIKDRIISELDNLPDQKGYSLLDFLHFLKQEQSGLYPNSETIEAMNEVDNDNGSLKTYSSVGEMFDDLGIGK